MFHSFVIVSRKCIFYTIGFCVLKNVSRYDLFLCASTTVNAYSVYITFKRLKTPLFIGVLTLFLYLT